MRIWICMGALLLGACGSSGADTPTPSSTPSATPTGTLALDGPPFAVRVVSFEPGEGAGFGQDQLPDVVLGPPGGGSQFQGSLDVLSLGVGGTIVLELGQRAVDGEGVDLMVFENAFQVGSEPEQVWAEPGEVSVSEDGDSWATFPCDASGAPWEGCAGKTPTLASPDSGADPTDPSESGGDGFDLADVGLSTARFVRIVDRATSGGAPSAGFDLDAVAVASQPSP